MSHAEAIKKMEAATDEAFSITTQVWRHVNSKPTIEFRVSVCADRFPNRCIQSCSLTLDHAVNQILEFLSPQNPSTLDSLDDSLSTLSI